MYSIVVLALHASLDGERLATVVFVKKKKKMEASLRVVSESGENVPLLL